MNIKQESNYNKDYCLLTLVPSKRLVNNNQVINFLFGFFINLNKQCFQKPREKKEYLTIWGI